MLRFGKPPYLECSSHGDRRFSAFYAAPRILDGKSIEHAYQSSKIFADGSTNLHWRKAKGRVAVNQKECEENYFKWWLAWIDQEKLLPVLKDASGLSDKFGQDGHVCQAEVLWRIKNADEITECDF